MEPGFTLEDLAARFGLRRHGPGNPRITGVGTLERAGAGQLAFLANPLYRRQLGATTAAAVVLREADAGGSPVPCLVAADPYVAFARIAALFEPRRETVAGIHPTAVIDPAARVAPGASIGAQCYVGPGCVVDDGANLGPGCVLLEDCSVGAGSELLARVTLVARVRLGCRVRVHPGAVIGAEGFGLAMADGRWTKVPQLGGVRIGDDCEIGANTTIDRGALADTVLEEDVRLDNQIQVGHNVHVGAHTAMAGCVAIAGSARIGRYCLIGGGVGIVGHIEVGDRVTVTARSLVTHSIAGPGEYSSGTPLQPTREWRRNAARFKQLDELARKIASLQQTANPRPRNDMTVAEHEPPAATAVAMPVDVTTIQALLPHRYPFLLVDRVLELEPNKRILAMKSVSINEPFFQGHFPGHPVMPGVLVLEALAQAGGLLTQLSLGAAAGQKQDKLFYLVKIDNARFSSMVVPGDRLMLEVRLKRMIRNMAMYECVASVDGKAVASADILCAEGRG